MTNFCLENVKGVAETLGFGEPFAWADAIGDANPVGSISLSAVLPWSQPEKVEEMAFGNSLIRFQEGAPTNPSPQFLKANPEPYVIEVIMSNQESLIVQAALSKMEPGTSAWTMLQAGTDELAVTTLDNLKEYLRQLRYTTEHFLLLSGFSKDIWCKTLAFSLFAMPTGKAYTDGVRLLGGNAAAALIKSHTKKTLKLLNDNPDIPLGSLIIQFLYDLPVEEFNQLSTVPSSILKEMYPLVKDL